tara:strand:- start:59 stop:316 length:258 start_codon:yes stop_codon:yes gene_type:complete
MSRVRVFTAEWCAPCKVLKAALEAQDDFEYTLIDVDEDAELVEAAWIRGIPTVIVCSESEVASELERFVGTKATVINILEVLNGR